MATATCQLSEEQFLCSICLDVFTDPVSLPCGHNFCKVCIEQHWLFDGTCKCPYCKQAFKTKPELRVNIFISEMAAQFRQSQLESSSGSEQQAARAGEIFCDFCTDPKLKAVKSCLVCLSSYCESHLEPHLSMSDLKGHQLTSPQRNLGCEAAEGMRQSADGEIKEMIATRQQKIKQLCQFMELNNKDANLEMAYSVQAFTALKDSVERDLENLTQAITIRRKTTEDKIKGYIKELEQEISELKTQGEKNVTKDWRNFSLCRPAYEGTAVRALAELEKTLSQQMSKVYMAELQRVQKYRVYVMLDPDKVHPTSSNQRKPKETDKPECKCVLSAQNFFSGRFYFEADVRGRSNWTLGLAKELHVGREVGMTPRNGYWTICSRNKTEWYAGDEPSVRLQLKFHPEKVGVFVDYEEGLVSFYDANSAALIYTFTGWSFSQKLHPFFSPCENNGVRLHTEPDSSCVLQ